MINEKFVKKQKQIIKSDITRLEKEIAANRKYLDLGSNNEDNALEFEAFEERSALTKNDEKELKELKKALERIGEGKYGICQKCGELIEPGRLKTYPAATYCATHAKSK